MKYIQYVNILHQFTIIYEYNKPLELKKPLFGLKWWGGGGGYVFQQKYNIIMYINIHSFISR